MDEVVQRILFEMKNRGFDQKRMAIALEISPQIITDWKKGKTNSYTRYIQRISELLGVSADYLLTGSEFTTEDPEQDEDPLWALWHEKYKALPPRKRIEAYEKFVKDYSV